MPRLTHSLFAALVGIVVASLVAVGSPLSARGAAVDPPVGAIPDEGGAWAPAGPIAEQELPPHTARVVTSPPIVSPAASPTVSGTLLVRTDWGTAIPVSFSSVRFWLETSPSVYVRTHVATTVGSTGEFSASLAAGTYRIEFMDNSSPRNRAYWNNETLFFEAQDLVLADDEAVDLGTVVIERRVMTIGRIAGADRFETAVELTSTLYDVGTRAPVVYIVNAYGFADALSAGPAAAAQGGVILPVRATSIPSVIRTELTRLNPERIVIAGGTGVVSTTVERQLWEFVDSPSDVDRVSGPDRYATSRAVVEDAFGASGLDAIFFATGRTYPDALAAGPAAARMGGAVLLVDGAQLALPHETRTLVESFGGPEAFIAGGPGAVSSELEGAINEAIGTGALAFRLSGQNRIETAARISNEIFSRDTIYPDFAFVATSGGFADALAAGPVAAAFQAPLFLTTSSCMHAQNFYDIRNLVVTRVFAVGGPGVLSDNVLYGPLC